MTTAIREIKSKVSLQEWTQRIQDRQNSGLSVKAWCRERGVTPSSYYFHLRKIREAALTENRIVPLEKPKVTACDEIRIESAGITIHLPLGSSPEQLRAIVQVLRSC